MPAGVSRRFPPVRRATTDAFACHIRSEIGEGLLHGIDCRSGRQVGANAELSHRDAIEPISTTRAAP